MQIIITTGIFVVVLCFLCLHPPYPFTTTFSSTKISCIDILLARATKWCSAMEMACVHPSVCPVTFSLCECDFWIKWASPTKLGVGFSDRVLKRDFKPVTLTYFQCHRGQIHELYIWTLGMWWLFTEMLGQILSILISSWCCYLYAHLCMDACVLQYSLFM